MLFSLCEKEVSHEVILNLGTLVDIHTSASSLDHQV